MSAEEKQEKGPSPMELKTYKGVTVWSSAEVEALPKFRVRADDVWVCSFPRSGTTLTQEMTYLIMTLDFEKANTVDLDDRFPIADVKDENEGKYYRGLPYLDQMESPRFIKSHFHYFLLPDDIKQKKGRVIYVARNPKAAVLSLYKILKYLGLSPTDTGCTLEEYFEYFLKDEKIVHGPWWKHVQEFWEHRDDENILFLQFESVVKDRRQAIRKIADFLGRDLSEDNVEKIYQHTRIDNMKKNDAVTLKYLEDLRNIQKSDTGFINKGSARGWEAELSPDIIRRVDEMLDSKLGHTDLRFLYQ